MGELSDLPALLEVERAALLNGDFDRLAEIAPVKALLLAELAKDGDPPSADLAAVGKAMQRNQRLLGAALAGLRDAAARMTALRRTGGSLETYGRSGLRETIRTIPPALEWRA